MDKIKNDIKQNWLIYVVLAIASYLLLYTSHWQVNPMASFVDALEAGTDISIFRYIGEMWFSGKGIPYRDIFDHKGPVLFFLQGLISLVSKYPEMNIYRLCYALLNFATAIFGYKLLLELNVKKWASCLGVILCTFLLQLTYYGAGCEEWMLLFMLAAIYICVRFLKDGTKARSRSFIVGTLISCIFLIRVVNVIPTLSLFIVVLVFAKNAKERWVIVFWATIGFLWLNLVFIGYFAYHGALTEYYEGMIGFSLTYTKAYTDGGGLLQKATKAYSFYALPLWINSASLLFRTFRKKVTPLDWVAQPFTLLTIATCLIGLSVPHYWYLILPAYYFAYVDLILLIKSLNVKYGLIATGALIVISVFTCDVMYGIEEKAAEFSRLMEPSNSEEAVGIAGVADYLKSEQAVSVLGYNVAPAVYWEADLQPSHRYWLFQSHWTRSNPEVGLALAMHLEEDGPEYIVGNQARWVESEHFYEARDTYYEKVKDIGILSIYKRKT